MARQKDPVEIELAALVKMTRTAIRTKHSIEADREIAEAIPAIENRFYSELQHGRKPKVAAKAIFERYFA